MTVVNMTPDQKALYKKIVEFPIDQPGVVCPFSAKLAWQYRWSGVFTYRAIREYKKFIFLVVVSDQRLSPATVIDRVWHQHILYTQSYWNDFCGQLLQRQIHHTPGLGGEEEAQKYYRQCASAIALYKHFFGQPPADIWNPPQIRVESLDYQWIDRNEHWVVPRSISSLKSRWFNRKCLSSLLREKEEAPSTNLASLTVPPKTSKAINILRFHKAEPTRKV